MENKKNVKQNFLQKILNFNFKKKKEKERDEKKKKKEEPILLSHSSSWAQQINISSTFVLIEKLVIWF